MVHIGDLVDRRPSDLAHALGDAVHAVDVGLAELAAVGVDRQPAAASVVAGTHEVLGLAARAETELLELLQHEGREVVVDHRGLDVGGRQAALLPELARDQPHLWQARDVVAVQRGHDLLAVADALRCSLDDHGFAFQVARALHRGDHHRHRTVAFLAAIQQAQRLADPARGLVIGQRDGLAMEEGGRVGGGEVTHRHADTAEVLAGGAVAVHVTLGEHADPRRRRVKAVRHVPAVVHVLEDRGRGKAIAAAAEAVPAALVHRAVDHHRARHAGGHGHGRVQHRRAGRAAPVRHLRKELDVLGAEQAGDLVLGYLVDGVGREAIHVLRRDAGIGQGSQRGLEGQAKFGAA